MGRYDLDDQRDRLERELTYAQDKIRAEKDEIWEFYKKKTQYKHDDDRVLADEDYGDDYGYGYGQKKAVQQENLYDNYDKLDVSETRPSETSLPPETLRLVPSTTPTRPSSLESLRPSTGRERSPTSSSSSPRLVRVTSIFTERLTCLDSGRRREPPHGTQQR